MQVNYALFLLVSLLFRPIVWSGVNAIKQNGVNDKKIADIPRRRFPVIANNKHPKLNSIANTRVVMSRDTFCGFS